VRYCSDYSPMALISLMNDAYPRESFKYGPPVAVGMFHWGFLAAPYPIPETLIQADYRGFLTLLVKHWVSQKHGHKVLEALDTYIDAYKNEGVIRGACEDYRAGATIDIENEEADLVSPRRKDNTNFG
jgi:haloacetate dehalogenase